MIQARIRPFGAAALAATLVLFLAVRCDADRAAAGRRAPPARHQPSARLRLAGDFDKRRALGGTRCSSPSASWFDSTNGFFRANAFAGGRFAPRVATPPTRTCSVVPPGTDWCRRPGGQSAPLGGRASGPPGARRGRFSFFEGPTGHCGHCGVDLAGNGVALSAKYMPAGRDFKATPACGKCICARVVGLPPEAHGSSASGWPRVAPRVVRAFGQRVAGAVVKLQVVDRCGECADEQLDIMLGSGAGRGGTSEVRALFRAARVGLYDFGGTGVADWDFVPCGLSCAQAGW